MSKMYSYPGIFHWDFQVISLPLQFVIPTNCCAAIETLEEDDGHNISQI